MGKERYTLHWTWYAFISLSVKNFHRTVKVKVTYRNICFPKDISNKTAKSIYWACEITQKLRELTDGLNLIPNPPHACYGTCVPRSIYTQINIILKESKHSYLVPKSKQCIYLPSPFILSFIKDNDFS